jgi:cytochrome b6-f complex iron-sulfur subunit
MQPAEQPTPLPHPSRRVMLATLGGVVVLPGALIACGSSSDSNSAAHGSDDKAGATAANSAGGGSTLPVAKVPVGQAVLVPGDKPVLVAQPTAGTFVAFSAICTHQGGTVGAPISGTATCPLHGSEFNALTGAVERGPALRPLPTVPVTRTGDTLRLG